MANSLYEHNNKLFHVGDKVRVVKYTMYNDCYINDVMKKIFGEVITVKYDCWSDRVMCSFGIDGESYTFTFLNEWLELAEKAKKPWNGKVICVESESMFFTKGKIYNVINGKLYDDSQTPYSHELTECPNEAISQVTICPVANFIEFKGEA